MIVPELTGGPVVVLSSSLHEHKNNATRDKAIDLPINLAIISRSFELKFYRMANPIS